MPFYGGYWLYNREMPTEGWPERLRAWLSKHECAPQQVSYELEDDRDNLVRAIYNDCLEHGFSARAFIDMAERDLGERRRGTPRCLSIAVGAIS